MAVVPGAATAVAISYFVFFAKVQMPGWAKWLELVWTVLLLGTLARESASCWQDGADLTLLPLVLIASAAFAVSNGAVQAARSGAALLWFVVPGVFVVLLAGISNLEIKHLAKDVSSNVWVMMPVYLLPVLGENVAEDKRSKLFRCTLISGLFVVAASIWFGASMPSESLAGAENAFYEYSKGITLFGVAERFEAVTACLLTAGWFALFAFLLAAVYEIMEDHREGSGRTGVWVSAGIAVLVLYNLPITMTTAGILTLIFWGVLPLATQIIVRPKKSEK